MASGLGNRVSAMNQECILYLMSIFQVTDDYIPSVKGMKSMELEY